MEVMKGVVLQFSGVEVTAFKANGTDILDELPKEFELRGQDGEFRLTMRLQKTPVIGQYRVNVYLKYPEDVKNP